jgi:hypothetical protein
MPNGFADYAPDDGATISAHDGDRLASLGSAMWTRELQLALDDGDLLRDVNVAGARRLVVTAMDMTHILADTYAGGRADRKTILTLDVPERGLLALRTIYRAIWAGYMLSLDATVKAGTNDRAHTGPDGTIETAHAVVAELGAVATPWSCVYGSDGTYMEGALMTFDAATGTLCAEVMIGS